MLSLVLVWYILFLITKPFYNVNIKLASNRLPSAWNRLVPPYFSQICFMERIPIPSSSFRFFDSIFPSFCSKTPSNELSIVNSNNLFSLCAAIEIYRFPSYFSQAVTALSSALPRIQHKSASAIGNPFNLQHTVKEICLAFATHA